VGYDNTTGKYRIVWNKVPDESIISYKIYRESNQAGNYLPLATVDADVVSTYIDESSSPEVLPHSYVISYMDSCGNESAYGAVHSTVHLTANLGVNGENNLIWTPYEGFAFLTYQIYRGNHRDSLDLFKSVSSNVTSFTDLNPPTKHIFYQIVVSREDVCQPVKKSTGDFSTAMSNVIEINTVGVESPAYSGRIAIFPNPASQSITITLTGVTEGDGVVSIYNLNGSEVASHVVSSGSITIPTEDLSDGIYMIRFSSNSVRVYGKFVIRH
jgi:hypothetical protein